MMGKSIVIISVMMVGVGATSPALADCATALKSLQSQFQTASLTDLADGARNLTQVDCADSVVTSALRQVSSVAARRAGAALNTGDVAKAEAALNAAPSLHWEVLAVRGGLAAANGDHGQAAQYYNQALDTLGAPDLTPQNPALEPVVPRLMALAQESMMLADSAQSAMRSDGSSFGVMRAVQQGLISRAQATEGEAQAVEGGSAVVAERADYNIVSSAAAQIDKVYLPVRFAFASDKLSVQGMREADALAAFIKAQNGLTRLTLIGHTDEVGAANANLTLSRKRAESVRFHLLQAGVTTPITIIGLGEAQPPRLVNPTAYSDEERRAIARRVEVSFASN